MNDSRRIERNIAQCRGLLSIAAPLAIYVDPTQPMLTPRFFELGWGSFFIDPRALAILLSHVVYSVAIFALVQNPRTRLARIVTVSTWGDVLFAGAIAFVTEGTNSPFYVYFLFAVLAAGVRGSFRTALGVTATSLALYVGLILLAWPDGFGFYLTRAVYLAITGYLVGFLGRQRRALESSLNELTRSLHDGYAQTLAAVQVHVENCREMIQEGQSTEALTELADLQAGIAREHDELRSYVRSLQGLATTAAQPPRGHETRFVVRAQFEAEFGLLEHAFSIMLEGARNVSRHARAVSALINASASGDRLVIRIDDDGVGFPTGAAAPWSIESRATEVGGRVKIGANLPSGSQLLVELPTP
jgi:signal transduction histidine kinase